MKIAEKVILLLNGGDGGFAAAISGSLRPNPNSNLQVLKDSFEFPLERFGIRDRKASGEIINFINPNGTYEVSILLLQNFEPPMLSCALNKVLLKLAGDGSSTMPILIVPFVIPESKLKQENKYVVKGEKVPVYGIKIGPTVDVTEALSSRLKKPPPYLQIHQEDLAVLLHLVNVMKIPTVVLIGQTRQDISKKASKDDLEVICQIGELLESVSSLTFSKEEMVQKTTRTSRDCEEAWRALYL